MTHYNVSFLVTRFRLIMVWSVDFLLDVLVLAILLLTALFVIDYISFKFGEPTYCFSICILQIL